jgi:hypothetical protein
MEKYTARVEFIVYEFEAKSEADANNQINDLVDQLTQATTDLIWDNVDWTLQLEGNN